MYIPLLHTAFTYFNTLKASYRTKWKIRARNSRFLKFNLKNPQRTRGVKVVTFVAPFGLNVSKITFVAYFMLLAARFKIFYLKC